MNTIHVTTFGLVLRINFVVWGGGRNNLKLGGLREKFRAALLSDQ